MLINCICNTKSESDLFLYTRNLLSTKSLIGFGPVNSQSQLCSQKAGIGMVLKPSGIQKLLCSQIAGMKCSY